MIILEDPTRGTPDWDPLGRESSFLLQNILLSAWFLGRAGRLATEQAEQPKHPRCLTTLGNANQPTYQKKWRF